MVADLTSWQPSQSGGNTAVSQCNLFLYISIHLYAHHNFHTHTHIYIYMQYKDRLMTVNRNCP